MTQLAAGEPMQWPLRREPADGFPDDTEEHRNYLAKRLRKKRRKADLE